ncbi:unnamed protein product [Calypogeia fissa]
MNRLKVTKSKAIVVVGLDFGTTFSGFAYALTSKPDECRLHFEWPGLKEAGASNYCKTQTSLLYSNMAARSSSSESYVLQGWGHEALAQHAQAVQSNDGRPKEFRDASRNSNNLQLVADSLSGRHAHFITRFKLHLAGSGKTSAADLPNGLTARRTISDYLRELSKFILSGVLQRNLGSHITMEDIQWCITVPAIWNEEAKQEMTTCAEIAGLVQGPHCKVMDASPHEAIIVLEPEAASFYCQKLSDFPLSDGDKFLVVDAGGGTVDLVLHQKNGPPWSKKVKELSPSSGGLCGGTYVDEGFFKFLSGRIRCFQKFAAAQPQSVLRLQSWWETIKFSFDGNMLFDYELELPAKLARAWEEDDAPEGGSGWSNRVDVCYDAIELTLEDMLSIFDPVVDNILDLINDELIPDLKAMMVVGGFSASPYLIKRIKEAYSQRLAPGAIIFPKEPGSAICCGAVAFGVGGSALVMSRVSKKTYGINTSRPFRQGDPEHLKFVDDDGSVRCRHRFDVFTTKGQTVLVDSCVKHTLCPTYHNQTRMSICLYSTTSSNPEYVTDSGTQKEGSFTVKHPSRNELGQEPKVEVSMYFGRTTIEVKAVGENFGEGEEFAMPPVTFESSFQRT